MSDSSPGSSSVYANRHQVVFMECVSGTALGKVQGHPKVN